MPESPSPERTVAFNARTFLINDRPEIFLSACIHYFRVPRALWADRIAKAKRGGMNTIETYVAWNFHELRPGVFDWHGDADLDTFLSECARQQMYVIVRPGPYICAEWDFGGFPAWLANVPGIAFRTMNAPYLDAVDRWFDTLVPIIERHQWTSGGSERNAEGGNVILVQVENEYANLQWTRGKDMLVDDDYQHAIRDALLRRGITVPLITCAGHCAGTIECGNSHNPADQMPEFRAKYPDKPIFSTEFWTAWYDAWGQPHHTRSAEDLEYASWRCWAEGACGYNYYVYHGGTNFGYTPMYLQTTSYDYDAPISETGRLTDKWRACRRVALFAQTFQEILTTGAHRRDLPASGGLRVSETRTPERGAILWVDNPDKDNAATGDVPPYLPDVTLAPRTLLPWVHDVPLGHSPTGNYLSAYAGLVKSDALVLTAHVLPDPHEGIRMIVYGAPDETREVVLWNGGERGQGTTVTFTDVPQVLQAGPSQIVALPTELAGRTWMHPNDASAPVVIGPDDVREHGADFFVGEFAPEQTHAVHVLRPDGALATVSVDAPALPAPPTLSAWQTRAEPDFTREGVDETLWISLDRPTSMTELGNGSNPYAWYRATVEVPALTPGPSPNAGRGETEAGTTSALRQVEADPGAGTPLPALGEGPGVRADEVRASVHFAACSDRLTLWVNGEKIGSSEVPPEDRKDDWTANFDVTLRPGDNTLAVLADGLGLIKGDWQIGKGQEQEKKGIYGPVTVTPENGAPIVVNHWRYWGKLYGERAGWWEPDADWTVTDESAEAELAALEARLGLATGGQTSAGGPIRWHRATFTLDASLDTATPLLVRLDGMGKGVLWLNGHNLGRYWQIGPQRDYYAPEPWLNVGENVLVLVETEGNAPENVALVWDERAATVVRVAV